MKEVDISQTLKDAENALRDFIALTLREAKGDDWIANCSVSPDRIEKWKERKEEEEKKHSMSGVVEERLIYYADFYDLETILKKNWQEFSDAFGKWREMEVWLNTLGNLRNPDAHRRELLPHQKHLAAGIAGEIRTRIVRFRNKRNDVDAYFPKIESIRDNYGNLWTMDSFGSSIHTDTILKVGDILEHTITASDPLGVGLLYRVSYAGERHREWQEDNNITIQITEKCISRLFTVQISVRSTKFEDYESTLFGYSVIPSIP